MAKKNYALPDEVMYHIGLSRDMINGAKIVLLPGDPGRVKPIAESLDNPKPLTVHREYTSYLAEVEGTPVLVCSTGMGGPSVAIGVEELARLGIETFIRVGTTGALQEYINLGDIIINDSAVRQEGTSTHYAPETFPAVADIDVTIALREAAKKVGVNYHMGVTISSDTFWPAQERYDSFTGYVSRRFQGAITEWRALGCTNMEMEAATLFTVTKIFGLKSGSVCAAIAKRTVSESVASEEVRIQAVNNCIAILKEAIKLLI